MKSPSNSAGAHRSAPSIPMASGSLLTKIHKGYQELAKGRTHRGARHAAGNSRRAGDRLFAISVTQKAGLDFVSRSGHDCEIARHRHAGGQVLRAQVMRDTGGMTEDVTDDEIPGRDQAAGRDGGHFCRDRRRRDPWAWRNSLRAARFRRMILPSSASPATA